MAVLKPEEYDISYFDGGKSTYAHNAGYSGYERWYRNGSNDWYDLAKSLTEKYQLKNKKVLDLGCAKGFLVEDLRSLGVDAFGIDVSSYALSQANPEVRPYLAEGDVRNILQSYQDKEFDLLFSRWFIYCFEDNELFKLVEEMNRICKLQIHIVKEDASSKFYNAKSITQYLISFSWQKGSILIPDTNMQKVFIK